MFNASHLNLQLLPATLVRKTGQFPGDHSDSDVAQWRMRWYPRVILATLGVTLVAVVMLGSGASTVSGRFGGDYPAFYGAGRIVIDSDWEDLYEANRQIEAQVDLHTGERTAEYLYFAYPPFVAAAYAPLALLPYGASFLVHAFLMAAAIAASIRIAGSRISILRRHRALSFSLALFFYPMFRAVIGGQNTALTLFLMVASWRLATDRHDFSAGLVLSLLLFKPQYAVPMILLYLLTGRWRALIGSLFGAAALHLVGTFTMGADWLIPWWDQVQEFAELDATVNGMNSISFIGFMANLSSSPSVVLLLGFVPALAIAGVLAFYWLKGRQDGLTEKMALAAAGLILISPHTQYYDGSLVLITLVVLEAHLSPNSKRIAVVWLVASTQMLAGVLGWSPFFFLALGIAVWTFHYLGPGLLRRAPPWLNVATE